MDSFGNQGWLCIVKLDHIFRLIEKKNIHFLNFEKTSNFRDTASIRKLCSNEFASFTLLRLSAPGSLRMNLGEMILRDAPARNHGSFIRKKQI